MVASYDNSQELLLASTRTSSSTTTIYVRLASFLLLPCCSCHSLSLLTLPFCLPLSSCYGSTSIVPCLLTLVAAFLGRAVRWVLRLSERQDKWCKEYRSKEYRRVHHSSSARRFILLSPEARRQEARPGEARLCEQYMGGSGSRTVTSISRPH